MRLVEQRDPEVPVYAACEALNVSRASLYLSWQPPVVPTMPPVTRVRAPNPRRLGEAERQEILDTLHLPEFADQPPAEVYATLLGAARTLRPFARCTACSPRRARPGSAATSGRRSSTRCRR